MYVGSYVHRELVLALRTYRTTWSIWTTSNHHHRNHTKISIDDLLERHHPVLYLDVDHKVDALRILCMTMWATTDEASSCSRATPMQYDTNKAMRALKDKIIFKHQEFQFKLRQAVIDVSIASYDNYDLVLRLTDLRSHQLHGYHRIESSYTSFKQPNPLFCDRADIDHLVRY